MKTLSALTTLTLAAPSLWAQEPALQADWIRSPINGHWYGVDYNYRSWIESEALSVALGGHLATIRTQAEQDWMAAQFGGYGLGWLGLNDADVEGSFAWSSGEPVTFTAWAPGEPNNAGNGNEDYAEVGLGGSDHLWQDLANNHGGVGARPFIELLEKPQSGWSWPRAFALPNSGSSHLLSADLNGDGSVDVAAGDVAGGLISVLLNDGAGNLLSGSDYSSGVSAVNHIVSLDYDLDGDLDLIVLEYWGQQIRIGENDGFGQFTDAGQLLAGGRFVTGAVADTDLDGLQDLIVTDALGHGVHVFRGKAGGGLEAPLFVGGGHHPWYVVPIDWDGDQDLDLVVASNGGSGSGSLHTLRNDGVDQWALVETQGVTEPRQFGVANLNGDPHADLIVPHERLEEVRTYLGDGAGSFSLDQVISIGRHASGLVIANGPDPQAKSVLVRSGGGSGGGFVSLVLTEGAGVGSTYEVLAEERIDSASAPDLDGDGVMDLIIDPPGNGLRAWLRTAEIVDCNSNGVPDADDLASGASADCDGDGTPDECQIAADASLDCNGDQILDSCQLLNDPSLDCDGDNVIDSCQIAGSPGLDQNDNGVLDSCECAFENYCLAAGNSTGQSAAMGASGSASLAANDLTLTVSQAPPLQFGLFIYGADRDFFLLGDGAICVKQPIVRLMPIVLTDAAGTATFPLDLNSPPFSTNSYQVAPFETLHFQCWFRDPTGGPSGFNFSDGLAVTSCP